ncbi:hypothetical protein CKAH01_17580 [Colletotrichum kahawae]|uniref:Uncharacterized protein n=1 Tax=Colletotrichum kahawae TaxID=34407 RepID=A0AAD9YCX4_COLKA|nr:hypothetical protein CKAH01_17580 [Colletotrichum kahawae]
MHYDGTYSISRENDVTDGVDFQENEISPLWFTGGNAPAQLNHDEPAVTVHKVNIGATSERPGVSQYQLLSSDASYSSVAATRTSGGKEDVLRPSSGHVVSWRPLWLRSTPLFIFMGFFVVSTFGLLGVYIHSQKHNGLMMTQTNYASWWRLGPVAVIIFESFQRRHYLVLFATLASLLIKTQVVLAPGLFSVNSVKVAHEVDVQILDSMESSFNETKVLDARAYYFIKALQDFQLQRPFGVTEDMAYQTFRSRNAPARGSIDAPLTVEVDGLFADMHCLKLESFTSTEPIPQKLPDTNESLYYAVELELRFRGCGSPVRVETQLPWHEVLLNSTLFDDWVGSWGAQDIDSGLANSRPCPNLPQQHNQTLFYSTRLNLPGETSSPVILSFAAIICTSTSSKSKVQVVDNGARPEAILVPDKDPSPLSADLWAMAEESMYSLGECMQQTIFPGPVCFMTLLEAGEEVTASELGIRTIGDISSYSTDFLYETTLNVSRTLFPLLEHYFLRETIDPETTITGSTSKSVDKLVVNLTACACLAVLNGILAFITAFILLQHNKSKAADKRDPCTILGDQKATSDAKHSAAHPNFTAATWSECNFTPFVLKIWVRAVCVGFTLSTIAALLYTYKLSETEGRLIVSANRGYLHFLWTSMPALIVLMISIYANCCSSAYRSLSTISMLSSKPCDTQDLDTSHLDMLGSRALFDSLRRQAWTVSSSQIITIMCGFLTTLASGLFFIDVDPDFRNVQLEQDTWLGSFRIENTSRNLDLSTNNRRLLSSLVLYQDDPTLVYPQDTYADLVFPTLGNARHLDLSEGVSLQMTVPARLGSICSFVQPKDYTVVNHQGPRLFRDTYVAELITCPGGRQVELKHRIDVGDVRQDGEIMGGPRDVYYAEQLTSADHLFTMNEFCALGLEFNDYDHSHAFSRTETYAWGVYNASTHQFDSLTIWRCNYTWEEVATEVNLKVLRSGFVLDTTKPPRPDDSITRLWEPTFNIPPVGYEFDDLSVGTAQPSVELDWELAGLSNDEFGVLFEPHGPFSAQDLRDPEKENAIVKELGHNYALIAAQLANVDNRFNMTQSSADRTPPSNGLSKLNATVTDNERRRLRQKSEVTWALVTITALVTLANIWALLSTASRHFLGKGLPLDMDVRGLAPDAFNSVAAMFTLLRGSNIWAYLQDDAEQLSSKRLYDCMADLEFRLGWFYRAEDQSRVFTVGVIGDPGLVFLGSKESTDKEEPPVAP